MTYRLALCLLTVACVADVRAQFPCVDQGVEIDASNAIVSAVEFCEYDTLTASVEASDFQGLFITIDDLTWQGFPLEIPLFTLDVRPPNSQWLRFVDPEVLNSFGPSYFEACDVEVNNLRTFSGNWAVVGSFSRSTEVPDSLFNLETSNFESGTWLFRLGIVGFGDVGVGSANVVIDLLGTCPSQEVVGCMDAEACNYNATANMDDGTCDYSCCPGPGCCDQGTHWSWESNACVVSNPADINMDGCVQLGDLLSLLGAYGDCPPAESTWECGDSLEYQGYNYETVLIGEQCWFAENLTAANYRNGDAIPSNLSSAEWVVSNDASTVYGEGTAICDNDFSVDFDNCDEAEALNEYGRLYNWHAVSDSRKLCPAGWVVPSDLQWGQMEDFLGVPANELEAIGWRGTTQGMDLKNETGWYSGIGLNAYQFSAKPSGYRWASDGDFSHAGESSGWWTSNATSNTEALYRLLDRENGAIYRQTTDKNFGFAIRCLKNLE